MIIPASDEYKVPGADDPAIQADMLATLGRDTALVAQALDHLARLAGQPLAELDPARREAVATEFRATGGAAAATLVRVVLQCYYRDDRVLRSLGLELRAPFPEGLHAGAGRLGAARSRQGSGRVRSGDRGKKHYCRNAASNSSGASAMIMWPAPGTRSCGNSASRPRAPCRPSQASSCRARRG